MVIVTSRSQLTSLVAVEGASPLTLNVLADADAREMLSRRLGAPRVVGDAQPRAKLIRLCAGLPLALSIAAARSASQPGLSLAALVQTCAMLAGGWTPWMWGTSPPTSVP